MHNWIAALQEVQKKQDNYVIVTVAEVTGSVPREAGAKMVVTADAAHGSIGGGSLEHTSINMARELLAEGKDEASLHSFSLKSDFGHACGGKATVFFEPCLFNRFPIVVFGAGHVGKSLVDVLCALPCEIVWIDPREEQFPFGLAANVKKIVQGPEELDPTSFPGHAYFVIVTHSHEHDFVLAEKLLRNGQFSYLGMIGSVRKRKMFEKDMSNKGMLPETISRLHSPIGLRGIDGKHPREIAIGIAAELLLEHSKHNH